MDKILIADDERDIVDLLARYFRRQGYLTFTALNGAAAVEQAARKPDAILLDINMPDIDGLEVCRRIREYVACPLVFLTARVEDADKVKGFAAGGDDYVVKPFSPKELMMRVNAVMNRVRRTGGQKRDVFRAEGLEVDFTARTVTVDGARADLSPKEYDLLFYLVNNRGIALTREMLITNVWGYDFYGDDRTLDTHIKLLRRSLGPYSRFIVTLRGVGYRFEAGA